MKILFASLLIYIVCTLFVVASAAEAMSSNNHKNRYTNLFSGHQFTLTALDEYVQAPNPYYKWEKIGSTVKNSSDYNLDFFLLTSQKWLDENNTLFPIWKHNMVVLTPTNMNPKCDLSTMWITWGNKNKNNGSVPGWQPKGENDLDLLIMAEVALATSCPVFGLYQVPDEPVCFVNGPNGDGVDCVSEDDAVGWSFQQYFLQNKSIEHTLLFPMTKAAVVALDAIEEIYAQVFNFRPPQWRHIVSGASKRGWCAWLTTFTNFRKKIVAVIPVVLDAINFVDFLARELRSYGSATNASRNQGAVSWVAGPYRVIGAAADSPLMLPWQQAIDPYFYRARLAAANVALFAINAVGDEFQLVDDQRHWLHDFAGDVKNIMIYDADHPLLPNLPLALNAIKGYVQSVATKTLRPSYTWSIDNEGQIWLNTSVPPSHIELRWAMPPNTGMRDFRNTIKDETPCEVPFIGGCVRFIPWLSAPVVTLSPTSFKTNVTTQPPNGQYLGFYILFKFSQPNGMSDLIFSSPTNVVPFEQYPLPADQVCQGNACMNVPLV
jgi:PhoPQ-activated pathogenicity-related protein